MVYLLRVELPDVPGSLGTLASALGEAGADIEAIEIVERTAEGRVVDDVLCDLPQDVLPDTLVSACQRLDDVRVRWVSRYHPGANLGMDLEAVEAMTAAPQQAVQRLVDLIPVTFRADWAVALRDGGDAPELVRATPTAPKPTPAMTDWLGLGAAAELAPVPEWDSTLLAGAPLPGSDTVVVFGRHGGPEVLASEVARLGHLVALAATVRGSG